MHLVSVLLGLVIAWVILFFIGPQKRVVSYYVQAPVVGLPISEIDSAMEAVGLAPSVRRGVEGASPAPAPAPAPMEQSAPSLGDQYTPEDFSNVRQEALPSVAQVALNESAPSFADQDIYSTPQAYAPSPSPSPSV